MLGEQISHGVRTHGLTMDRREEPLRVTWRWPKR
jgi:hypothetical protein